uniref:EF-hand domain-containing protein n=1 Tax=Chromera velia CCMP2878 TaxID=1169474 RepID=A0A0G4G595_9ALVE|eukprot:Cvel_20351.t1-p1 / transcript=Cvel_20351.t1 / gene=Cvel_20351 / organism=Chromera_velia_CCMP2878 / gene_product=hypothetical protein / transcript_product=hypothetical protein / location=Cvel_scaffold1820:1378-6041(+) / protein_length=963 / sequence_SO=supercontig / SO=protein_coding / is_pseudo=false
MSRKDIEQINEASQKLFEEFASDRNKGFTFSDFVWFVRHCCFLSNELHHDNLLDIFHKLSGGNVNRPMSKDAFKSGMGHVADIVFGDNSAQSVLKVIKHSKEKRDELFEHAHAEPVCMRLSNYQILSAAYEYKKSLKSVYCYYASRKASDPRPNIEDIPQMTQKMTARSFLRFCKVTGMIPIVMVEEEIVEQMRNFLAFCSDKDTKTFFERDKLIQDLNDATDADRKAEEAAMLTQQGMSPANRRVNLSLFQPTNDHAIGEPQLEFPFFVEILVAVSLTAPPRVTHQNDAACVHRVHAVLRGLLQLPPDGRFPSAGFDVEEYVKLPRLVPQFPPPTGFSEREAAKVVKSMRMGAMSRAASLRRVVSQTPSARGGDRGAGFGFDGTATGDVEGMAASGSFERSPTGQREGKEGGDENDSDLGEYEKDSENEGAAELPLDFESEYDDESVGPEELLEFCEKREARTFISSAFKPLLDPLPPPPFRKLTEPPKDKLKEYVDPDEARLAAVKKKKKKKKKADKKKGGDEEDPVVPNKPVFMHMRPPVPSKVIPPQHDREPFVRTLKAFREKVEAAHTKLSGPIPHRPLPATLRESLVPPVCEENGVTTLIASSLALRENHHRAKGLFLLVKARERWVELRKKKALDRRGKLIPEDMAKKYPIPEEDLPPKCDKNPMNPLLSKAARVLQSDARPYEHTDIPLPSLPLDGESLGRMSTQEVAEGILPGREVAAVPGPGSSTATIDPRTVAISRSMREEEEEVCPSAASVLYLEEHCADDIKLLPPALHVYFLHEAAAGLAALGLFGEGLRILSAALRSHVPQLGDGHPDAALCWSTLGSISFSVGEYEVAARAFLKCRQVRESTVGENSPVTAATYLNVGASMLMLDRVREAFAFTKLGHTLLSATLGESHTWTFEGRRNLRLVLQAAEWISGGVLPPAFEVPHLYWVPTPAFVGGKKKKKGGDKGKKK